MAEKKMGQLSFADGVVSKRSSSRRDKLKEISDLIDWERFGAVLQDLSNRGRGEANYPPLMMFKVLLLQRWYGLGDEAMEEALYDRLSFRSFAGLSLEDDTPDHSTIWRFRERLGQESRIEALMAELARQLEGRGVYLKQGTLIDASIVESAARRPRMKESRISTTDPDARFGVNNERRRYKFGYKVHIAVDQGTQLVRTLVTTPANIQEIDVAEQLVQGDEAALYADRGYDAKRLHDQLSSLGIADGVMRRGKKAHPLSDAQKALNNRLSIKRRPVEAVFGTLKRSYQMGRMRAFTMARNHTAVALACFAYNLRRLHVLTSP